MFGLGKYVRLYKLWRKLKPIIDVLTRKGAMKKVGWRKLGFGAFIAALGSVLSQLGMDPDAWKSIAEWLAILFGIFVGGNGIEHVAEAIKVKKGG